MTEPAENIALLTRRIKQHYPHLAVTTDAPIRTDGVWWIDFRDGSNHSAVSWQVGQGFGIYPEGDDSFGARPTHLLQTVDAAIEAIGRIVAPWTKATNKPSGSVAARRAARA